MHTDHADQFSSWLLEKVALKTRLADGKENEIPGQASPGETSYTYTLSGFLPLHEECAPPCQDSFPPPSLIN